MPLTLRAAARSDVGLVRSNNQDSAFAGVHLVVVADGMGGHAGGDVASSVAIGHLAPLEDEAHGADAPQQLEAAIARAQTALLERVAQEPALSGMGTTVTALLRSGDRLVLAHLGDSRAYLLHEGELTQVTRDHTFVQRLVDEGRITAEEAEHHPQRNVILRVLGDVQSSPEVDLSVRRAVAGDRWLLCSDGLSGVVSDDTLREALSTIADPGACADRLVQLALRGGGPDNVTCVVADVVDAASAVPAGVQVVGSAALDRPASSAAASTPAARAAVLARSAGDPDAPGAADDPGGPRPEEPGGGGAGATAGPSSRRRRARGLLVGALVLVVLAGGLWAGSAWLSRQYYVGADGGRVAIFRGLSQDVGPLDLSSVVQREDTAVDDLPTVYRERVEASIGAADLTDARRIVADLRSEARAGSGDQDAATPSPSPTDGEPGSEPGSAPTDVPTGEVPSPATPPAPGGSATTFRPPAPAAS